MIVETSSKLRFAAIGDVCVDVASEMSVFSAGLAETHYLVWLKWSQQKLSRKALESNHRIKYTCVGFSFWCRNPMLRFGVLPSVDVACEE